MNLLFVSGLATRATCDGKGRSGMGRAADA